MYKFSVFLTQHYTYLLNNKQIYLAFIHILTAFTLLFVVVANKNRKGGLAMQE